MLLFLEMVPSRPTPWVWLIHPASSIHRFKYPCSWLLVPASVCYIPKEFHGKMRVQQKKTVDWMKAIATLGDINKT
jgi:hypothetical protein